jgi:hypothetical protein
VTVAVVRIDSTTGRVEPLKYRFEPNPEYTWAQATYVLGNILERIIGKRTRQGGPSSAPDLLAQVADSALSKRDLCDLTARVGKGDGTAAAEVVRRFGRENPPDEDVDLAWLRRGAPALRNTRFTLIRNLVGRTLWVPVIPKAFRLDEVRTKTDVPDPTRRLPSFIPLTPTHLEGRAAGVGDERHRPRVVTRAEARKHSS